MSQKLQREIIDLVVKSSRRNHDASAITPSMRLVEELGFDSIELIKLVVSLEERYNIQFNPADLGTNILDSVDNVTKYISKRLEDEKNNA